MNIIINNKSYNLTQVPEDIYYDNRACIGLHFASKPDVDWNNIESIILDGCDMSMFTIYEYTTTYKDNSVCICLGAPTEAEDLKAILDEILGG